EVVDLTLLRVGQDLVGQPYLLEPLLGLRVRVDVRMQLAGETAVRLLDLLLGGVTPYPQDRVVVGRHSCNSSRIRTLPALCDCVCLLCYLQLSPTDQATPDRGFARRNEQRLRPRP